MIETMISSSVLILLICLLRFLLRGRVSPGYLYSLWGLAVLRLIVPWFSPLKRISGSLKSRFSVMNAAHMVREQVIAGTKLEPLADNVVSGRVYHFDGAAASVPAVQQAAGIDWQLWILAVWVLGSLVLSCWMAAVTIRFYRKLIWKRRPYRGKLPGFAAKDVYVVEGLASPCYFGFGPEEAIYLPYSMADEEEKVRHALAHEMGHVRHGDRVWGALRCILLCYYWINPFVWLAAVLSRRDCELACDEAAVRLLGEEERYAYGRTLIGLAAEQQTQKGLFSIAMTMGTGKQTMKERIQVLANHPKRTVPAAAVLTAVAAVLTACTFTGRTVTKQQTAVAAGIEAGAEIENAEESRTGMEAGTASGGSTGSGTESAAEEKTKTEASEEAAPSDRQQGQKLLEPLILTEERQYGTLYILDFGRLQPEMEESRPVLADPALEVNITLYEDAAGTSLLEDGYPEYGYSCSMTDTGIQVTLLNAQHAAACRIVAENDDAKLEYLFVTHDPEPLAEPGTGLTHIFAENGESLMLHSAEVYSNLVHLRFVGDDEAAVEQFRTENLLILKLAGKKSERYEYPQQSWQKGNVLDVLYCLEERISSPDELEAIVTGSDTRWEGYVANRLDYAMIREMAEKFKEAYMAGDRKEAERYLTSPAVQTEQYPLDARWDSDTVHMHILEEKPVLAEVDYIFRTDDEADGAWKLSLWVHKAFEEWKIEQLTWSREE